MDMEKARKQHYYFVHEYLREKALRATAVAMEEFWQDNATKNMKSDWTVLGLMHKSPDDEFISADGVEVQPFVVSSELRGVVITFPEPKFPAEAFMIAFVAPADAKPGEKCKAHYITLEFSPPRPNKTVLCQWIAAGAHLNHGSGPVPVVDAFIETVREYLSIGVEP